MRDETKLILGLCGWAAGFVLWGFLTVGLLAADEQFEYSRGLKSPNVEPKRIPFELPIYTGEIEEPKFELPIAVGEPKELELVYSLPDTAQRGLKSPSEVTP